jgi:membrane associated rhomboid family serine protease
LTWLLCGMTGSFLLQFGAEIAPFQSGGRLVELLALSRENLLAGRVWTLLTHGMLHSTANILHVTVSLAGIFLLGRALEQSCGTRNTLLVLVSSTLVGGLVWILVSRDANASLIGATAGVYGLLACLTLAEPSREWRVLVFFAFPIRIRPRPLVAVLAATDAVGLLIEVLNHPWPFAYAPSAHLGGLAAGWGCYRLLPHLSGNGPRSDRLNDSSTAPLESATSTYPRSATDPVSPSPAGGDDIRKQVDRILDKINREGLTALTDGERRTLDNARDLLNRR